ARTYPSTWWNRTAFVCGPTGHLVGTFVISKDGADFTSTSPCNLVSADDEWAAPIMAEVGPDGNVWVLDWYNYIVQHNPTPQGFQTGKGNAYESDLRDKKHGRIYRVVYTAGDEVDVHSLAEASIDQLVETLTHPTMLWRKQAQRLLVEKADSSAVPGLIELIKDKSQDAIGLNVGAIHALWTLHGLGELNDPSNEAFKAAVEALKHPSAGVRRNAVAVLPAANESTAAIVAADVLSDNDSQVQLAAVLALADMPQADDAGQKVAGLAGENKAMSDRWLGDAVTAAGAKHAVSFLAGLAEIKGEPNNRALEAASVVAEHIARGKPDSQQLEKLLDSLASSNSKVATAVINGMTEGWPTSYQPELTDKLEDSLLTALKNSDADSKADVIRLASLLGSRKLEEYATEISKELLATASDEDAAVNARVAAAAQMISLQAGSDDVVAELLSLVTPNAVPEFSTGVMNALRTSKAPGMGPLLAENAALGTPSMRETAISVLLTRPEATAALLDAIQAGDLSLGDVKLDQKQLLNNYPDETIRKRAQEVLAAGGQLPNADRQKVLDELMPVTHLTGDATAGKEIFKKHCAKCHKHSGEGENIGPELTGMAVHPKEELLMHIIDPSRSVEGNFRIYSAVLTNGRVISGMLAGESRTSVELIDAEAKRHPIPRSDLEELTASKKSLMPEGFEKQMTKDELSNLLEFLTAKGKYVPLDLRKVASVVSTTGMFSGGRNRQERMVFPDWSPKTFEGVPFQLIDPQGDTVPNMLLMYGPNGTNPPRMPK
ncbi:MAG: c-type cytochrome, partial [Planctomycetales bacterium]|nr:c-type cytochrome [Planctomycetales bacterium]